MAASVSCIDVDGRANDDDQARVYYFGRTMIRPMCAGMRAIVLSDAVAHTRDGNQIALNGRVGGKSRTQ